MEDKSEIDNLVRYILYIIVCHETVSQQSLRDSHHEYYILAREGADGEWFALYPHSLAQYRACVKWGHKACFAALDSDESYRFWLEWTL
jgi:hypothetical protein